ncbi:uncharacterized protein [Argopecten irradians]|uniref:uncharacterized protein isoform X1 n=1 Tax=Argopecten irradians TaxID=31199 RepID=UPI00371EE00C
MKSRCDNAGPEDRYSFVKERIWLKMSAIRIKCSDEKDDTVILFPIGEDGLLTIEDLPGRRGNVTMEKILRFCTGSEEEPTLGFSMQPTIEFSAIALPMANTCTNKLSLPLTNLNTELFDMAFLSEYFGYQ